MVAAAWYSLQTKEPARYSGLLEKDTKNAPHRRYQGDDSMTDSEIIALIDHLRALPTETEWVEFKRNYKRHSSSLDDAEDLGEYISALANGAYSKGMPSGYLVYGIDDDTHDVVGTTFDPYDTKVSPKAGRKGNQNLLAWLPPKLHPNPGFQHHAVDHPDGRVVLIEIGPARGEPVLFGGTAHIRFGSSKTLLSKHREIERAIWLRGHDWSAEVCGNATLDDLDTEAIAKARQQFSIKNPRHASDVAAWDDRTFLNKARVLKQGAVTNTALLLLGRPESTSLLSPAVAKISWILKDENGREQDYEHVYPPFLLAGDRLLDRVRNLTIRALPSGTLFPKELPQYDSWVIREALHNCIAHQDYHLHGRISVVEFPDHVILTNVGDFLPGNVETVIQQDAPQAVYRNPFLADAMVELNLIDTQGGGIKRMFEAQRRRSFPLPDYDLTAQGKVAVSMKLTPSF